MKNLLKKIFGGDADSPSSAAKKCLTDYFENAQSVEWIKIENGFEAIFYINNQEYIAHISNEGILLEYKINLDPSYLPDIIKVSAREYGELMNSISIHKTGNDATYELITRNKQLERFTVLFKADGSFIRKTKL